MLQLRWMGTRGFGGRPRPHRISIDPAPPLCYCSGAGMSALRWRAHMELLILAGLFAVGFLLKWAFGETPLPHEEQFKRWEKCEKVFIQQPFPHLMAVIPPKGAKNE